MSLALVWLLRKLSDSQRCCWEWESQSSLGESHTREVRAEPRTGVENNLGWWSPSELASGSFRLMSLCVGAVQALDWIVAWINDPCPNPPAQTKEDPTSAIERV